MKRRWLQHPTTGALALILALALVSGVEATEIIDLSGRDASSLAFGRLAQASAAWKGSLGYASDAWGNATGPGYVSASRPDFLSAPQLDFLKSWYDARPELGIRIGRTAIESSSLRAALAAEEALAAAGRARRAAEEIAARTKDTKSISTDGDAPKAGEKTDAPGGSQEPTAAEAEDTPDLAAAAHEEKRQGGASSAEHRASFLFDGARTRAMNILSPRCSEGDFEKVLQRMQANGDTVAYLFVANEGDGDWAGYSPFGSHGLSGDIDEKTVRLMKARLAKVKAAGLDPILWLRADDSDGFNGLSLERQKRYQAEAQRLFDDDCRSWVLGLELDEYFTQEQIRELCSQLKGLTSKKVGVHFTSLGKVDQAMASGADQFYGQYGFDRSPSEIESATRQVVKQLNDKMEFIAAEYHKSADSDEARALGQAALRGGARGTGNGR